MQTDGPETLETYARAWLDSLTGNLKASNIKFYGDNLERPVPPLEERDASERLRRNSQLPSSRSASNCFLRGELQIEKS